MAADYNRRAVCVNAPPLACPSDHQQAANKRNREVCSMTENEAKRRPSHANGDVGAEAAFSSVKPNHFGVSFFFTGYLPGAFSKVCWQLTQQKAMKAPSAFLTR